MLKICYILLKTIDWTYQYSILFTYLILLWFTKEFIFLNIKFPYSNILKLKLIKLVYIQKMLCIPKFIKISNYLINVVN